jgi:type IV secretory pathway ATPase VirB11/archaellum biosynthesis ATPase
VLTPPDGSSSLYWIRPDEYEMSKADLSLLREVMGHVRRLGAAEVASIPLSHARQFVLDRAAEILQERLEGGQGGHERRAALAHVVARYTVGLGALEHLVGDPHITDIYGDAPGGDVALYVSTNLSDDRVSDRLSSNVTLCPEAVAALVTRARLEAGRPFSHARPYLEHDLKEFGTRLTVVGPPASPAGLAVAIRRHASSPLTLANLVAAGALEPMTAGLLSVLVEGECSLLIGGPRGAGKTTLLGALMLEMDPCKRIVTIEDTLELPVEALRSCGYRVQSLLVRSALGGEGDLSAEEALRISLRLGESCIVMGEVRGREAQTLYEAMRTGATSSAVMGTIHGSPASAVCARAVHDLGVAPESFAATDAIVIAGLLRPGGARRQIRRVTEVAQVRLLGSKVVAENLLRETDAGPASLGSALENSELLARIASAWGLPPSEIVKEARTRGELKRRHAALSLALAKPDLLGIEPSSRINTEYARLRNEGARGLELVQSVMEFAKGKWA